MMTLLRVMSILMLILLHLLSQLLASNWLPLSLLSLQLASLRWLVHAPNLSDLEVGPQGALVSLKGYQFQTTTLILHPLSHTLERNRPLKTKPSH